MHRAAVVDVKACAEQNLHFKPLRSLSNRKVISNQRRPNRRSMNGFHVSRLYYIYKVAIAAVEHYSKENI